MRRHAHSRASAEGQVLLETLSAGDWFVRHFAVSLETLNGLLFRDVGEVAAAEVEREKDAVLDRITGPEFHAQDFAVLPMTVTPAGMRAFHDAALKRYALAERAAGWESASIAERASLANRLFLETAMRFALIRTRLYAGKPIPVEAPHLWSRPDGSLERLRVDLISPVTGYHTPA